MTDPVEQRHTVTRAVDMLHAEGFAYACEADLLDPSPPRVHTGHETHLGDRLGHLTHSISQAAHTGEVVVVLSELTAPGDGVLDRLTEALAATADWWEGLGSPTDPLYADRLRARRESTCGFDVVRGFGAVGVEVGGHVCGGGESCCGAGDGAFVLVQEGLGLLDRAGDGL
jgi:hypothetical protein